MQTPFILNAAAEKKRIWLFVMLDLCRLDHWNTCRNHRQYYLSVDKSYILSTLYLTKTNLYFNPFIPNLTAV